MRVFFTKYRLTPNNPFKNSRNSSVLVVAEHNTRELKPSTITTLKIATKIDKSVIVLVPGTNSYEVAKYISTRQGIDRVLTAENVEYDGFPEEDLSATILATQTKFKITHILASSSELGNSVLSRVAAKLNVPAITNIVDVKDSNIFVRPIYAGNAVMTLKLLDPIKVLTVKEKSFPKMSEYRRVADVISRMDKCLNVGELCAHKVNKQQKVQLLKIRRAAAAIHNRGFLSGKELLAQERFFNTPIEPAPFEESKCSISRHCQKPMRIQPQFPQLTNAKIVVCGGKGLQSSENFKLIYDLAYAINAVPGATKSAVDKGYAPKDLQIGQLGTKVAPSLYIGVGLSGKPEHIAGIKESKTIIAINADPNAEIFEVCNYGLVMDLFDAVPTIKYLIKRS